MNHIKYYQFIVIFFDSCCKIETCISLKHDFVVSPLEEVGQPAGPSYDHATYLVSNKIRG